jgi:hypothetical protein
MYASHVASGLPNSRFCLLIRRAEEEKGGGSQRFHPWPCVAKRVQGHSGGAEWISNEPRVRVFKVTARERPGFAKHREVPERKAAALAAAKTDAGETATSPRAGGTLSKKTTKKTALAAAATAAAEGKARKKRGARPIGSPPTAKRTRVVDVETGAVGTVIAAVPLRSAAPSGGGGGDVGGPLLVPLSPKEKDNDEESDVCIVSSVGEASRGRSPPVVGHEAPCDEGKSSSASISSSSSSSQDTGQSTSHSTTGAEKDDFVAEAEEEKEDPESSNYHVTLKDPQAAAVCLQIPSKAKLIGGKQICFLGLMSGGQERKFLEEAGSSFTIPHEDEYFGGFSSADLITTCGDLMLKNFVASRCLARKLEREDKEAKDSSAAAVASLQTRVAELERLLAAEQDRSQRIQQEKENEVKASQAALESLRTDVERLASAKEDLSVQLRNKEAELVDAKNEAGCLNNILERYRTQHI